MNSVSTLLRDKAAVTKTILEVKLGPLLEETFNKWHGDDSQQAPTPLPLILEMITKIGFITGEVLIISNVDIFVALVMLRDDSRIIQEYISPNAKLTLLTDTDIEVPEHVGTVIKVDNLNKPAKIDMMGKKFDIAIANPPYNDDSSSVDDSNLHKSSKTPYKQFIDMLTDCSDKSAVIAPTKSYWVGPNKDSTKRKLTRKGLYRVSKTDAFNIGLKGIGVYYFDKDKVGTDIEDEFEILLPRPKRPLGDFLIYGSGSLISADVIADVKEKKFNEGTDTLYVTQKRDVFPNLDLSSYPDPSRGKWRVILSQNGGEHSISEARLIKPGDGISYSCVYFEVPNAKVGNMLVEWLAAEEQQEIASNSRGSSTNSKDNFAYFETPSFLYAG